MIRCLVVALLVVVAACRPPTSPTVEQKNPTHGDVVELEGEKR